MFTTLAILVGLVVAIGVAVALVRGGGITVRDAGDPDGLPPDLAALDDAAFRARLQQEIAAGRVITAIKWLRIRAGLGLKEAKDAVEAMVPGALEQRVEHVRGLDDAEFHALLLVELAAGRKIEAIRLYRERTGLGLKEAKDAIDALEGRG